MIVPPSVQWSDDTCVFRWERLGIVIDLEGLREERETLKADMTIAMSTPLGLEPLHSGLVNLKATQWRAAMVKALSARKEEIDWYGAIEQVCFLTREHFRNGDPAIDLRSVDYRNQPRWLLEPYVDSRGASIVFADGGSGKSVIALAMAIGVASGKGMLGLLHGAAQPVMYVDWESSPGEHAERFHALCRGFGLVELPEVLYRRAYASLAESVLGLRRDIAKLGVGFVVIDSLGAAAGGEPESADLNIRMFMAARSLGVPWLGIDHISNAARASGDAKRPFGSTYKHNLARITWSLEKVQGESEGHITIALRNHKANNHRIERQRGCRIEFIEDDDGILNCITIRSADLMDVPEFNEKSSVRDRVLYTLQRQKMKSGELADYLDANKDTVRNEVGKLKKAGRIEYEEETGKYYAPTPIRA